MNGLILPMEIVSVKLPYADGQKASFS